MTQRTTTEIAADLAACRTARSALIAGERVEDVSRDGRRMKLSSMTLEDFNTAIADLEREYAAADAAENGRPRRRAIGLRWAN